jgi:hypothetical protein
MFNGLVRALGSQAARNWIFGSEEPLTEAAVRAFVKVYPKTDDIDGDQHLEDGLFVQLPI